MPATWKRICLADEDDVRIAFKNAFGLINSNLLCFHESPWSACSTEIITMLSTITGFAFSPTHLISLRHCRNCEKKTESLVYVEMKSKAFLVNILVILFD